MKLKHLSVSGTPFKVAHTADWHLAPTHQFRRSRGEDFMQAARSCMDQAAAHGCGVMTVGGDILHSASNQPVVLDQLRRLDDHARQLKLFVLVIDGNHDRMTPSWFDVLHELRDTSNSHGLIPINDTVVRVDWPSGGQLSIAGIPAGPWEEFVAKTQASLEMVGGRLDCLVWHGSVQELMNFPDPNAAKMADMPTAVCRAILMGDIHQRQFQTINGCLIGYPGSTETYKRDDSLTHSMTVVDFSQPIPTEQEVPIWHRKAVALRIETEDQLNRAIAMLKEMEDEHPVVFLTYERFLGNVTQRLYTQLNPDAYVLRPAVLPPKDIPIWLTQGEQQQQGKQPSDFVPKFFVAGSDLSDLALRLCDPNSNHNDLLRSFVATRLQTQSA